MPRSDRLIDKNMNNLQKQYRKEVVPALMKRFGRKNPMAVPLIKKVVINVGIGKGLKEKEYLDTVIKTLTLISGQKPVETLSRKSISNFKIRIGMVVGVKVTLRGARMWDFLEKLIKVTLPRVRDFRGISGKCFDRQGNYSLGFQEYVAFPEIKQDEVERLHGLEVIISMNAKNQEEGRAVLAELGFPFRTEEEPKNAKTEKPKSIKKQ